MISEDDAAAALLSMSKCEAPRRTEGMSSSSEKETYQHEINKYDSNQTGNASKKRQKRKSCNSAAPKKSRTPTRNTPRYLKTLQKRAINTGSIKSESPVQRECDPLNSDTPWVSPGSLSVLANDIEQMTFQERLHLLLSQENQQDAIAWLPHGKMFCIIQPMLLIERKLLQSYFGIHQVASFVSMLYKHGFQQVECAESKLVFHHKAFSQHSAHTSRLLVNTEQQVDYKDTEPPNPKVPDLARFDSGRFGMDAKKASNAEYNHAIEFLCQYLASIAQSRLNDATIEAARSLLGHQDALQLFSGINDNIPPPSYNALPVGQNVPASLVLNAMLAKSNSSNQTTNVPTLEPSIHPMQNVQDVTVNSILCHLQTILQQQRQNKDENSIMLLAREISLNPAKFDVETKLSPTKYSSLQPSYQNRPDDALWLSMLRAQLHLQQQQPMNQF